MASHADMQDEVTAPLWDRSVLAGKEKSHAITQHALFGLGFFAQQHIFEVNHIIVCINSSFLYINK